MARTVFVATDAAAPARATHGQRGTLNIHEVPADRISHFVGMLAEHGPAFALTDEAKAAADRLNLFAIGLGGTEEAMRHGDYMLIVLGGDRYQIASWSA